MTRDATRTIIARNTSPDIPFDRSINPYRGCEHGCIYCFARPTHAYLGLSPGARFRDRDLFPSPNAAELLAQELSAPNYVPMSMAMGTNTDPYQPVERKLRITRSILEVLRDFNHPVGIVTKSPLVMRDIDILADMARDGSRQGRAVGHDARPQARARRWSRAPRTPQRRLEAIKALAEAGIPTGVMSAPMIPGLNDHEMEAVLRAAAGRRRHARGLCRCCACRWRSRTCSANGWRPTARPRQARDVAGPPDARRQGLRQPVAARA